MKLNLITTKFFRLFCLVVLTACSSSKEQTAATMAVQTIQARATGTAAVEQAVSDALTKAAPTHTATSTATPMSTHPPTFTATPEVQQYFTEEFDGGLENWSTFREGTKTPQCYYDQDPECDWKNRPFNEVLLTGNRSVLPVEDMQVEDGFLKIVNQKMEINYAIYEPFEYEEVRIDVRFENKGSDHTYVNLICNYTEDEGWYEIVLSPRGTWYIGYAKAKGNDVISHDKFHPQGGHLPGASDNIRTGLGVNEFTAICQGDKITLFINGSLETEIDVSDFGFGAGKVGVAVRAHKKIPAKIDFDWVKISSLSASLPANTPIATSETDLSTPEHVEYATPGPPPSGLPKPETSEYLQTNFGAFSADIPESGDSWKASYLLSLNVLTDLPSEAFIETHFENPSDPLNPIVITKRGPQPKELELQSPPLTGVKCKTYWVEVIIYDSPDKGTELGRHVQWIKSTFDVDKTDSLEDIIDGSTCP